MVDQLSVFAENKKGVMMTLTGILSEHGINIVAAVANDSAEFGILRLIVSDPQKAVEALKAEGYQCRLNPVIAIELSDEVGSLHKLLQIVDDINVNVNYLHITYSRRDNLPVMLISVSDMEETEASLEAKGFKCL